MPSVAGDCPAFPGALRQAQLPRVRGSRRGELSTAGHWTWVWSSPVELPTCKADLGWLIR